MKIDCKKYAQEILDEVKASPKRGKLAIITVGENAASESYVKGKKKDCDYCGIEYEHYKFFANCNLQGEVITKIIKLNHDKSIGGIIVQLPLPDGWDEDWITGFVSPEKDVDGFVYGSHYKPCTPEGIIHIMKKEFGNNIAGKEVLLIGKGKLVGKPLLSMLLDEGCTVRAVHSKTNPKRFYRGFYNVVISAVGKPVVNAMKFFTPVSPIIFIDAGISRNKDGKLTGDIYNYNELIDRYTPVPGGVGLLTRAMLMRHMVKGDTNVT